MKLGASDVTCPPVTPLGTHGPAYGAVYYTPTLRLALWHAFRREREGDKEANQQQEERGTETKRDTYTETTRETYTETTRETYTETTRETYTELKRETYSETTR